MAAEKKIVVKPTELQFTAPNTVQDQIFGAVLVYLLHGGIPIVFISIHGVVTHSLMFRFFVYLYTKTQPNFPHPQWSPTEGRSFTWFICFLIKFENARFSNTLPALRIQPFTRRTIPVTRDIPMIRKWFPPLFEVFINLEPRVTAAWLAGVLIRDRWLLNRNTQLKPRAQGYFGSLSAVQSPGIGRYVMYGELCMTYFGK